MHTKEQQRSAFALKCLPETLKKEEANFWVGLPNLILQNGLGQSIAFCLSKAEAKHTKAVDAINGWLAEEGIINKGLNHRQMTAAVSALEQAQYIRAQQEIMRVLIWFKRYARAFQEADEKDKK